MSDFDFTVASDPRMQHFIGGFDERGHARPLAPERLQETVDAWPTTHETPEGVVGLLQISQHLFVHSVFVFEFATVGALVSLQAVERALRVRLDSNREFAGLIERAAKAGIIDAETRERLEAGRGLRNLFSHPEQPTAWPFGMTAGMLESSHEIIADLFPATGAQDLTK